MVTNVQPQDEIGNVQVKYSEMADRNLKRKTNAAERKASFAKEEIYDYGLLAQLLYGLTFPSVIIPLLVKLVEYCQEKNIEHDLKQSIKEAREMWKEIQDKADAPELHEAFLRNMDRALHKAMVGDKGQIEPTTPAQAKKGQNESKNKDNSQITIQREFLSKLDKSKSKLYDGNQTLIDQKISSMLSKDDPKFKKESTIAKTMVTAARYEILEAIKEDDTIKKTDLLQKFDQIPDKEFIDTLQKSLEEHGGCKNLNDEARLLIFAQVKKEIIEATKSIINDSESQQPDKQSLSNVFKQHLETMFQEVEGKVQKSKLDNEKPAIEPTPDHQNQELKEEQGTIATEQAQQDSELHVPPEPEKENHQEENLSVPPLPPEDSELELTPEEEAEFEELEKELSMESSDKTTEQKNHQDFVKELEEEYEKLKAQVEQEDDSLEQNKPDQEEEVGSKVQELANQVDVKSQEELEIEAKNIASGISTEEQQHGLS